MSEIWERRLEELNKNKLSLAILPTPIQKLNKLSEELGVNLWLKRDDLTGIETAGNKIRKLEYTAAKALSEGAKVLITCGGIQSNHCRATAAVAARIGISSHLVLRTDEASPLEGNYLLDKILGAEITFVTRRQYATERNEIMAGIAADYEKQGIKAYVIPEGASDGVGNLGYINAVKEITEQEKQLGINFNAIVSAVGSGGTYSGLYLGRKLYAPDKEVISFNVCDDEAYFLDVCSRISQDTVETLGLPIEVSKDDMCIIDGYKGIAYAVSTDEELAFIAEVARKEGVILDPVYTGKAFYGLYQELKKGNLKEYENILFIHTGGLYGLFPKQEQFAKILL
ncbi:MAG: D-cysteine desulfhydrase family protein [Lachnospiraceae bacterium]|nr:D-cysteine desulfhydrase family protein [Lachnospiraceae bacterium]